MTSVREATFELLRRHGMTTVFGNPGSTELPMLADFPEDFRYVLGLHELVAVGMADGYAQATGRPAHVNLHTAPGVGNAIGAILGAQHNRSPLLITAGQQVRAMVSIEAGLTNRDPTLAPAPYVKYAHEPPRAQDVPGAIARAIHHAAMPPRGPAFVSIPMDDWNAEADADRATRTTQRIVSSRSAPDSDALAALAARLGAAARPVLVAGAEIDDAEGWELAVALAERQRLPVHAPPVIGSPRLGFPEDHPQFLGTLPPAIGPLSQALEGYDLVVVIGAPVFTYYPYVPGPLLPEATALVQITNDPDLAARAAMGDAIIGDVGFALARLLELCGEADPARRPLPDARPVPEDPSPVDGSTERRMSGATALAALAAAWPSDAVCVLEAPSAIEGVRRRLRIGRPHSYHFSAGGGLGFGIAAAVGVGLGAGERPVVCVLGEGSAQYGIQALWSAVAYRVPVTFLVLRNDEYAILKWFGSLENVSGVPGLDLPGLDVAAVARGYGMPAREIADPEELVAALREGFAAPAGPRLIQVPVAPGMVL